MVTTWEVIEETCRKELGERVQDVGGDYDSVEIIGIAAEVGKIIAITTIQHMSTNMLGYDGPTGEFLKHLHEARRHLVAASSISDS